MRKLPSGKKKTEKPPVYHGMQAAFVKGSLFEDGFYGHAFGDFRQPEGFYGGIEGHVDYIDLPSDELFSHGNAGGNDNIGRIVK